MRVKSKPFKNYFYKGVNFKYLGLRKARTGKFRSVNSIPKQIALNKAVVAVTKKNMRMLARQQNVKGYLAEKRRMPIARRFSPLRRYLKSVRRLR